MIWLARVRRTVWTAAVAVLLVGPLGPVALTHAGLDDPSCDATAAGQRRGPSVEGADAASRLEHCAVCHWLHLLRTVTPAEGAGHQAPASAGDLVDTRGLTPARASSCLTAGRSPPSSVR